MYRTSSFLEDFLPASRLLCPKRLSRRCCPSSWSDCCLSISQPTIVCARPPQPVQFEFCVVCGRKPSPASRHNLKSVPWSLDVEVNKTRFTVLPLHPSLALSLARTPAPQPLAVRLLLLANLLALLCSALLCLALLCFALSLCPAALPLCRLRHRRSRTQRSLAVAGWLLLAAAVSQPLCTPVCACTPERIFSSLMIPCLASAAAG